MVLADRLRDATTTEDLIRRRSGATTPPSRSPGCARSRSSTKDPTASPPTTSHARRSTPICAGATATANSESFGRVYPDGRHGPLRPGDEVYAGRSFTDAEAYQAPSPSFNVLTIVSTQVWMSRPRPAWDVLGLWTDPEAIEPMMRHIDHPPVPEAFHEVGGMRLRRLRARLAPRGIAGWLELVAGREFDAGAGAGAHVPAAAPTPERAAELLGLPFSTDRRHLSRGVEHVVDRRWQRELFGATEQDLTWKVSTRRGGFCAP